MRIGQQVQAQTPKPVDEDFVRGLLEAAGAPAGIRDTFTPAQAPAPAAQTAQDRPLSTRQRQAANQRGGSPDAAISPLRRGRWKGRCSRRAWLQSSPPLLWCLAAFRLHSAGLATAYRSHSDRRQDGLEKP